MVGDFGGGGMLLAVGVLAAILESRTSGMGQVVDAAMTDGAALLAASVFGHVAAESWSVDRGTNLLDSGAPFYDVYETADNRFVAVGALEPQFYESFVRGLGLDPASLPPRMSREHWPELREIFATRLREHTRDEWVEAFAGTDACVAPVLTFLEAPADPHNAARQTFVDVDGVAQPAPAPRFSRTETAAVEPPRAAGADTETVLRGLDFGPAEIERLMRRRD
jgi:alpha-methylacyl-CoA racemase